MSVFRTVKGKHPSHKFTSQIACSSDPLVLFPADSEASSCIPVVTSDDSCANGPLPPPPPNTTAANQLSCRHHEPRTAAVCARRRNPEESSYLTRTISVSSTESEYIAEGEYTLNVPNRPFQVFRAPKSVDRRILRTPRTS